MFTTQEFFKNNPDEKLGAHSETVAKWMLVKFRSRFPWFNHAISTCKFDEKKFLSDIKSCIAELTPFQIRKIWLYIDKERANKLAPTLKEFREIIGKLKARSMNYDEIHQEAMNMGAIVYACRCGYCYENKDKISIEAERSNLIKLS